jgi:hypothetical protein
VLMEMSGMDAGQPESSFWWLQRRTAVPAVHILSLDSRSV